MSKNRFKSEIPEEEKSSKKKSKRKFSPFKPVRSIISFFSREQTKQIIGMFFILLSAYLLIAFTSFLFTWETDQSKVELPFFDYFFDSTVSVENWLGKTGASLAHFFIYQGFGISSFLFVGLTFLIGFRILLKISLLPFGQTFRISAFFLFWLSLFFGYFFQDNLHFLGGSVGSETNLFLSSILGSLGTGILIFFLLFLFVMIQFNVRAALEAIRNSFLPLKRNEKVQEEDKQNEEETFDSKPSNEDESDMNEEESEPEDREDSSAISLEIEESENSDSNSSREEDGEGNDESKSTELNLDPESKEETDSKEGNSEGLSFEIEETNDKEETLSDREVNQKLKESGDYDPTLDLSNYQKPGIDLLKDYGDGQIKVNKDELEANKDRIVNTLENYNIKIQSIKATIGPTVTLYEIVPAPGVRISKIKNLEDDIALSLAALGIRIIAPIPGKERLASRFPTKTRISLVCELLLLPKSFKIQNSTYRL